ncbi:LuxE/PaaK family acyltransferase [Lentilactobacillus hilgardii]|uniref:LuxE/PaaK family acyltransferase n=1 Tax=Lentilactobacillus hilgardii TaxID=1588 RepID=UPI003FA53CD2
MTETSTEIQNKILAFINRYSDTNSTFQSNSDFNEAALTLFNYQFQNNLPFRKYAQSKRKSPLLVKKWEDIPLMPIQGYKQLTLSTTPITKDESVFMSSGTTDPTHRSRNYHPVFNVWDASMKYPFKQYVLPDRSKMTILGLFPSAITNSNSSLSRYVSKAIDYFGDSKSHVFVNENGMDYQGIVSALNEAQTHRYPVMLLGASFSYVHLLDYLKENNLTFKLPKDSRLFDTGGFKGQSRSISPEKLFQTFQDTFNIDRAHYINMYGMTEICSQCYDQNLFDFYHQVPINYTKKAPAWVRIQILDTNTLKPLPNGKPGLIAYYDLSNWNSCLAILTEDMGVQNSTGFRLLGRIQGAEAKGCSIAVDQLLQANQN